MSPSFYIQVRIHKNHIQTVIFRGMHFPRDPSLEPLGQPLAVGQVPLTRRFELVWGFEPLLLVEGRF